MKRLEPDFVKRTTSALINSFPLLSILFLALVFFSCSKDDTAPVRGKEQGVIEKYLQDNPRLVITPAHQVPDNYWTADLMWDDLRNSTDINSAHGFMFMTAKPIRLKSLGVKLAQSGRYRVELFQGPKSSYDEYAFNLIAGDSITVTDVTQFVFNPVANEVILDPNKFYMLRCWVKNYDPVYQAGIPNETDGRSVYMPMIQNDITISGRYFGSRPNNDTSGRPLFSQTGIGSGYVVLRGLVDFKYEAVQ